MDRAPVETLTRLVAAKGSRRLALQACQLRARADPRARARRVPAADAVAQPVAGATAALPAMRGKE